MTTVRRPRRNGATIYFQAALRETGSDLLVREINLLRFAVAATLKDWPVTVHAWTVLPDHMMCIWTMPPDDCDYSTRWRLIKSRFSRGLPPGTRRRSDLTRGERAIWQRRFWEHHIRGQADFDVHMRHCYSAPARQGLVRHPDDWRYSSFFKARAKVA